ncbi:MAG: OB-fold nucleic acid binding domain-containing protein, partial [Carbonactinosporaceae bacterium]
MAGLGDALQGLVGGRTAKVLAQGLDLHTVGDLLRHYPRRYAERGELTDLSDLRVDEHVTVMAEVARVSSRTMRNRRGRILEVIVTDGRGQLALTFFNQPWRERDLRRGMHGLFAGKVSAYRGTRQLTHPDYQLLADGQPDGAEDFAGALIPVYPATAAMPSWKIAQCVRVALDTLDEVEDPLPEAVRRRRRLIGLREAFDHLHRPDSWDGVEAARLRLRWDE